MKSNEILTWLLEGDIAIQYLTHKWLMESDEATLYSLQSRIETEGFGARILSCRNENGHWANGFTSQNGHVPILIWSKKKEPSRFITLKALMILKFFCIRPPWNLQTGSAKSYRERNKV